MTSERRSDRMRRELDKMLERERRQEDLYGVDGEVGDTLAATGAMARDRGVITVLGLRIPDGWSLAVSPRRIDCYSHCDRELPIWVGGDVVQGWGELCDVFDRAKVSSLVRNGVWVIGGSDA